MRYVAVSETKDGYWVVISRPTTKEEAENFIAQASGIMRNEVGKVVTLEDALAHKKIVGAEYLTEKTDLYSDIIRHLNTLSLDKFTDHASYILSGDWDRINGRAEDKAGRDKISVEVAHFILNSSNKEDYLDEIKYKPEKALFGKTIKRFGRSMLEKGKEKGKELGAKAVEKGKEYAQRGAEKGKEYAKKGFEKSKEFAKEKVKDAQKGVVKKVINETRSRASVSEKEAFTLKSASQIIDKKFKTGGDTKFKSPKDLWDSWDLSQRNRFFQDHESRIPLLKKLSQRDLNKFLNSSWNLIPRVSLNEAPKSFKKLEFIQQIEAVLDYYINERQFKTGGRSPYQPPLFIKGTKYTLSQVDSIIYNALIKRFKVDATMLAGRKMVFKNKKNNLSAEMYLDTVGTSGVYNGLRIQIINSTTQEKGNSTLIKLSDIKYGEVPAHYKGNINTGGYYWDYDKEFYAYVPDFNLMLDDVEQYLAMMDVVQSSKYKCGGNMALGGNTAKGFVYQIGGL